MILIQGLETVAQLRLQRQQRLEEPWLGSLEVAVGKPLVVVEYAGVMVVVAHEIQRQSRLEGQDSAHCSRHRAQAEVLLLLALLAQVEEAGMVEGCMAQQEEANVVLRQAPSLAGNSTVEP